MIWTWNANKKSHDDVADLLDKIDRRIQWDVLAQQEVGSRVPSDTTTTTTSGHHIFISATKKGSLSTGVAVHSSIAHAIKKYHHGERFTTVDLGAAQGTQRRNLDIRIISAHLPSDMAMARDGPTRTSSSTQCSARSRLRYEGSEQ